MNFVLGTFAVEEINLFSRDKKKIQSTTLNVRSRWKKKLLYVVEIIFFSEWIIEKEKNSLIFIALNQLERDARGSNKFEFSRSLYYANLFYTF